MKTSKRFAAIPIVLLCMVFLLATTGCSGFGKGSLKAGSLGKKPAEESGAKAVPNDAPAAEKDRYGAAVLLTSGCPLTPEAVSGTESWATLLPVAISLVTPAVEFGMDKLAAYMEKRAKAKSCTTPAKTDGILYEVVSGNPVPQPRYNCVVFVKGTFGNPAKYYTYHKKNEGLFTQENMMKLHAYGVNVVEPPDIYAEFAIEYNNENPYVTTNGKTEKVTETSAKRYFRLKPLLLNYRKSKAKGKNPKDLLFTFNFFGPTTQSATAAKKEGEEQNAQNGFAVPTIGLSQIEPGTRLERESLKQVTSGWWALPSSQKETVDVQENATGAKAAAAAKPATKKATLPNLVPFNLEAVLVEDGGENDLLLWGSNLVKEKKSDLGKALEDLLKEALGSDTEDSGGAAAGAK